MARAWFIGGNPFLNEDTPLTAIREDGHNEVIQAVKAFLEDRQDVRAAGSVPAPGYGSLTISASANASPPKSGGR